MLQVAGIETVQLLVPELVLLLAAVYVYLAGTFVSSRGWWTAFGLASFAIAAVALWRQEANLIRQFLQHDIPVAVGPLIVDWLSEGIRNLALITGAILLAAAHGSGRRQLAAEYVATVLVAIVGLMLVGRANNAVILFLGLEMISIPTYILLFLGGRGRAGMEATVKYFFLSLLSSAALLYGLTMLYGIAGTTTLVGATDDVGITAVYRTGSVALLSLGSILVLAGIGFKLTAFPFHFYAPDVYHGAGWAGAAFLATIPKVAAVAALIRLFGYQAPASSDSLWKMIAILAAITMTFGNTCALWQTNVRRMLAYSSIAHAGYMLVGLAATLALGRRGDFGGLAAMFFYAAVYLPASLATFAGMITAEDGGRRRDHLNDLRGMGRERPVLSAMIALGVFSLAGIPPLAGFWGKLGLFGSLIATSMGWVAGTSQRDVGPWLSSLLLITAINAAIGAAYYLRLLSYIYFVRTDEESIVDSPRGTTMPMAATVAASWLVVLIGVMPSTLLESASRAERMLVPASVAQTPVVGAREHR